MLGTREYYDLIAQFDEDFRHLRLDKEPKDGWVRGHVYQNGEANELFKAYQKGYAFSRCLSNMAAR